MGLSVFPAPSGGLSTARFPASNDSPFMVPAGLTLQNTVTSTTTFSAGQLPAQVWIVAIGGGGGGSNAGGGGGGGACIGWVDVPSSGITATIGAGGASVSGTSSSGNQGGNTYFGPAIAYGGGGGNTPGSGAFASYFMYPRGTGAGCGGSNQYTIGTPTPISVPSKCSPFMAGFSNVVVSASLVTFSATGAPGTSHFNKATENWNGGGGGAWGGGFNANFTTNSAAVYSGISGLTGGGGAPGSNDSNQRGGNSSRDGGITNTYTGGANAMGGGGGAGLLANGSAGSGNTGGNGGSGGGGGGANWSTASSGAGGNGCVLIYY